VTQSGDEYNNNNDKDINTTLRLVGTFSGHTSYVATMVEKDTNTIITGSWDGKVKEWNTTTCECTNTDSVGARVYHMVKSRNESFFVCGLSDGHVQMRRLSDLSCISSFKIHLNGVSTICELAGGTYVSAEYDSTEIKRWNKKGRVIRTYSGHKDWIFKLIELRRNVIVSIADNIVNIWKASSGECLRTISLHRIFGLVKLSEENFVTLHHGVSRINVWDGNGNQVESIQTNHSTQTVTRFGDTIVSANQNQLKMWRLK